MASSDSESFRSGASVYVGEMVEMAPLVAGSGSRAQRIRKKGRPHWTMCAVVNTFAVVGAAVGMGVWVLDKFLDDKPTFRQASLDFVQAKFEESTNSTWASIDKNHNGKVDGPEFSATLAPLGVSPKLQQQLFFQFHRIWGILDANKDGNIQKSEIQDMLAPAGQLQSVLSEFKKQAEMCFYRYDKDGDLALTPEEERDGLLKDIESGGTKGLVALVYDAISIDLNGDGKLDGLESQAQTSMLAMALDMKLQQVELLLWHTMRQSLDHNHDGMLSQQETFGALAALVQHAVGHAYHRLVLPAWQTVDADGDGIEIVEIRRAMGMLLQLIRRVGARVQVKVQEGFQVADYNDDGELSDAELAKVIRILVADASSSMPLDDFDLQKNVDADALARATIAMIDSDGCCSLSWHEMQPRIQRVEKAVETLVRTLEEEIFPIIETFFNALDGNHDGKILPAEAFYNVLGQGASLAADAAGQLEDKLA
mmetsp:Transcript_104222/g.238635  ORF Transcript_104222/g.238635 Transcript_104222/m.238635 type:complete len:482 (-) Transcript_104222:98-1543(-)